MYVCIYIYIRKGIEINDETQGLLRMILYVEIFANIKRYGF